MAKNLISALVKNPDHLYIYSQRRALRTLNPAGIPRRVFCFPEVAMSAPVLRRRNAARAAQDVFLRHHHPQSTGGLTPERAGDAFARHRE